MAILEVKDLEVYYGIIKAIKGISFEVNEGEIIALIGANGAGKTTTLHTITGLLSPKKGQVLFEGTDITKIPAHKIVGLGMAHVPEGRRVFANLSVYQNLKLGAYTRKDKDGIEKDIRGIYDLFPRLEERSWQMAGTLSGGEQQKAAIGKILLLQPKLLLLDEPTKGIDAWSKRQLQLLLKDLSRKGITILMVTHDVEFAAGVSDRCGLFFDHEITSLDTPEEFFCNNNYYTTAANRISRHWFENTVTCEDVVALCRQNGRKSEKAGEYHE